jgi:hypothetical protein
MRACYVIARYRLRYCYERSATHSTKPQTESFFLSQHDCDAILKVNREAIFLLSSLPKKRETAC